MWSVQREVDYAEVHGRRSRSNWQPWLETDPSRKRKLMEGISALLCWRNVRMQTFLWTTHRLRWRRSDGDTTRRQQKECVSFFFPIGVSDDSGDSSRDRHTSTSTAELLIRESSPLCWLNVAIWNQLYSVSIQFSIIIFNFLPLTCTYNVSFAIRKVHHLFTLLSLLGKKISFKKSSKQLKSALVTKNISKELGHTVKSNVKYFLNCR